MLGHALDPQGGRVRLFSHAQASMEIFIQLRSLYCLVRSRGTACSLSRESCIYGVTYSACTCRR